MGIPNHRNKWVRCHSSFENKSFRILRTDVWQNKIILRQRLAGLCLGPVEVFIKMATQPEISDFAVIFYPCPVYTFTQPD